MTEGTPGLEQLFVAAYDRFDAEEADLHRVIRGYTEYALFPLNTAILKWLESDDEHRTGMTRKSAVEGDLAVKLADLQSHLLLWIAKYRSWIIDEPKHALVYLADEQRHGLGFPSSVEEALRTAIHRRAPGGSRS